MSSFRSEKDQSTPSDLGEEGTDNSEDDIMSDQVPTLSIHEKSSDAKGTPEDVSEFHGKSERVETRENIETETSEARKNTSAKKQVGKELSIPVDQTSHSFGQKGEERGIRKVSCAVTSLLS